MPLGGTAGSVTFDTPVGERTLQSGDVIGRLWSAPLCIPDPRVSEFHGVVSARSSGMWLFALRSSFRVDGVELEQLRLAPGQAITLAPGVEVRVLDVRTPVERLVLWTGGVAFPVNGVVSLVGDQVRTGWRPEAEGTVFPDGRDWQRTTGDEVATIRHGDRWRVGEADWTAELLEIGALPTEEGSYVGTLRIRAAWDTVVIHASGMPRGLVISGLGARLLSELVDGELPWEVVASRVWPELPQGLLRKRWDVQLARLRRSLRQHGLRPNLLCATGGRIGLLLNPGDEVVDEL